MKRRDVLKLAAFASASRAGVLPAIDPAEAARLLDEEADTPMMAPIGDESLFDPADFATVFYRHMGGQFEELCQSMVAEDWSAFEHARNDFVASMADRIDTTFDSPWMALTDKTIALVIESFIAGMQMGAGVENLRLAVLRPTRTCPDCWGSGSMSEDGTPFIESGLGHDGEPSMCPTCNGVGHLPTPGVRAKAVRS
jgi:hypothetical protein